MTPVPYTEDTLVQQTTAEYLERQLGWRSVYAYNIEDFGPGSLLGRASDLQAKVGEVFYHVYRVYPTIPSPFYSSTAAP